jgi:hypothetical protein
VLASEFGLQEIAAEIMIPHIPTQMSEFGVTNRDTRVVRPGDKSCA